MYCVCSCVDYCKGDGGRRRDRTLTGWVSRITSVGSKLADWFYRQNYVHIRHSCATSVGQTM